MAGQEQSPDCEIKQKREEKGVEWTLLEAGKQGDLPLSYFAPPRSLPLS